MKFFSLIVLAVTSTLVSAHGGDGHHGRPHGNPPNGPNHQPQNGSSSAIPPGQFTFEQLWNMTNHFWTQFLSPNNELEAKSINSTLFSDDVKGKIDATRTFDGRELNTEYAFGLFSQLALNPGAFSLLGVPLSYKITQFAANTNIVACTLTVDFEVMALKTVYPVEIVGWFTYNAKGEVSQYDATFLRGLDWQFATMTETGMKMFGLPNVTTTENFVQLELAKSVCNIHQQYCNGTNQQYANMNECMSFLTNGSVPLGLAWQLGMDTVGCRMVHMNMVPYRPAMHCPHIGPTGGSYCTNNREYAQYTTEQYFTNQAFLPEGKVANTVMGSLPATQGNSSISSNSTSSGNSTHT